MRSYWGISSCRRRSSCRGERASGGGGCGGGWRWKIRAEAIGVGVAMEGNLEGFLLLRVRFVRSAIVDEFGKTEQKISVVALFPFVVLFLPLFLNKLVNPLTNFTST